MKLSPYRKHRIYIAAIMGYALGSNDDEELAYYLMVRNEKSMANDNLGIDRID